MRKMAASLVSALSIACAVALVGCGQNDGRTAPSQQQGVSEVMQEQMQGDDAHETTGTPAGFVGDASSAYEKIDYDLTTMGSDMVYATVYDMMQNPSSYKGKVVRMGGPYYHTFYEQTGLDYYYVVIQDATACCAQGLEFVWGDGSHVWPDEYPADETEVVVTGVFDTYQEDEAWYAHLVDASLRAA